MTMRILIWSLGPLYFCLLLQGSLKIPRAWCTLLGSVLVAETLGPWVFASLSGSESTWGLFQTRITQPRPLQSTCQLGRTKGLDPSRPSTAHQQKGFKDDCCPFERALKSELSQAQGLNGPHAWLLVFLFCQRVFSP